REDLPPLHRQVRQYHRHVQRHHARHHMVEVRTGDDDFDLYGWVKCRKIVVMLNQCSGIS
ncbi:unnamed protein product, partial [Musa hybrid cultivar]